MYQGDRGEALAEGTIYGDVIIGPTCPVERMPPDPNCADKPFEGEFALTSADGSNVIKNFSSDANGKFSFEVARGEYLIRLAKPNIMPSCFSDVIKLEANSSVYVVVSCDSGIR